MTFDQLRAFIASPSHVHQIALTKPAARQLLAEHEREAGKPDPAFEINTRNRPVDALFQLARLKRMRAEDEAFEMKREPEA